LTHSSSLFKNGEKLLMEDLFVYYFR